MTLSAYQKYPDLIARAGGKITSAIVLNDQYPGALERGSIFPQLEAELFDAEKDIRKSPITPDNCPGDGQTCHVNYRSECSYLKWAWMIQIFIMMIRKPWILQTPQTLWLVIEPNRIMVCR